MTSSGELPGPLIEVGVGDTLNLTLDMMMAPQESAPYNGHTIHLHGADLPTPQDGVPETNGNQVNGQVYTWTPTDVMNGSFVYHCHVHTVKHLDMGMYGPLLVKPKDVNGNILKQLTANTASAYDAEQIYLFSSVDPAYHTATGDSAVFADYNPTYFLINGNEGSSPATPAVSLSSTVNQRIALHLMGVQSVNGTFRIKDTSGNDIPFTVFIQDGRAWPAAEIHTTLDISPGERFDVIVNTPQTSGVWYPQFVFKDLRNGTPYSTVYTEIAF